MNGILTLDERILTHIRTEVITRSASVLGAVNYINNQPINIIKVTLTEISSA